VNNVFLYLISAELARGDCVVFGFWFTKVAPVAKEYWLAKFYAFV